MEQFVCIPLRLPEPFPERALAHDFSVSCDRTYVTEKEVLDWIEQELVPQVFGPREGKQWPRLRIHTGIRSQLEQASSDHQNGYENGETVSVEWDLQGLLGGKGGFGAGLRAMGKTAAARQKPSNDFSLCRDLQGNRLGAINTSMVIAKAKQEAEAIKEGSAAAVDSDQWLLDRPSWIEGAKKVEQENANKRKEKYHRKNQTRQEVLVKPTRENRTAAFELSLQEDLGKVDDNAAAAVAEGLAVRKRSRVMAENEDLPNMEEDNDGYETLPVPDGIKIISGKAAVIPLLFGTEEMVYSVVGISNFATVAFPSFPNREYQALVKTEGLIQIGYAVAEALVKEMEHNLDGVGDVKESVGLDLVRNTLWLSGQSLVLKDVDSSASSAGCFVDSAVSLGSGGERIISFKVNGKPVHSEGGQGAKIVGNACIPTVSLERGETLQVRFTKTDHQTSVSSSSSSSDATSSVTLEELEGYGPDRLKNELKQLGLKFGGTVNERARRLLIARTLPREDWPRSIFPS